MRNTDFRNHRFWDRYSRFFSIIITTNMPAPFQPTQICARRTNRRHPFLFFAPLPVHGEWPLYFFVCCALPREAAPSDVRSKAERNPMLLSAFDRRLLTFSSKTPAFEPLFQLPPAIGPNIRPSPKVFSASPPLVSSRQASFRFLRCKRKASRIS